MTNEKAEPGVCPCKIERLCGNTYIEVRLHDGGTALIDPRTIAAVSINCFGRAVVTTDLNGHYATIHEYAEVIQAMKELSSPG
jgi:hypothetical protein